MKLNALLMCRQLDALRILVAALEEYQIEQEACVNAPEAMELLAQDFYSALVVDFEVPGAATVARMARLAPSQRRPVVFAVIDVHTDIASAYQAGANFVLYKPLQPEQVERSLRAARVFMQTDRRRSRREKLESMSICASATYVPFLRWCSKSARSACPYRLPSLCPPSKCPSASSFPEQFT